MEWRSRFNTIATGYGARWSEEEDGELLSLKAAGFGYKRLTAHFPGRTRDAIRSRHRELRGQGRDTRPRKATKRRSCGSVANPDWSDY